MIDWLIDWLMLTWTDVFGVIALQQMKCFIYWKRTESDKLLHHLLFASPLPLLSVGFWTKEYLNYLGCCVDLFVTVSWYFPIRRFFHYSLLSYVGFSSSDLPCHMFLCVIEHLKCCVPNDPNDDCFSSSPYIQCWSDFCCFLCVFCRDETA